MYKVITSKQVEDFDDYFTARARAEYLYLYGNEVQIEKDGKVISKFVNMGVLK